MVKLAEVEKIFEIGFLEILNIKLVEVIKDIKFIKIDSNKYDFANDKEYYKL